MQTENDAGGYTRAIVQRQRDIQTDKYVEILQQTIEQTNTAVSLERRRMTLVR